MPARKFFNWGIRLIFLAMGPVGLLRWFLATRPVRLHAVHIDLKLTVRPSSRSRQTERRGTNHAVADATA